MSVRKVLGVVTVITKECKDGKRIRFKGYYFIPEGSDKIIHGVYFNMPRKYNKYLYGVNPFEGFGFYCKLKNERHLYYGDDGEYYTYGISGLDEDSTNDLLTKLNGFKYKNKKIEIKVEIEKKWKLVKDSWILENL